jgi:CheY-like chemotaxis protein
VQRGLEENGYQVSLAYDGLSGLRLAAQNEYSLIITDIILPKVNGLDVCKELKQARPDTPVIMLTALGTTDDKVEGFDAGDFNFRSGAARRAWGRASPGTSPPSCGSTTRRAAKVGRPFSALGIFFEQGDWRYLIPNDCTFPIFFSARKASNIFTSYFLTCFFFFT